MASGASSPVAQAAPVNSNSLQGNGNDTSQSQSAEQPPLKSLSDNKLFSIDAGYGRSNGNWYAGASSKGVSEYNLDDISDYSRSSSPDFTRGPGSGFQSPSQSRFSVRPNEKSLSWNTDVGAPDEPAEAATPMGVGRLPDDVYEKVMSPWRAAIRRVVTKNIVWESEMLAVMQVRKLDLSLPLFLFFFLYLLGL